MAHVLITGANGMLGGTLVPLLESHHYVVIRHGLTSQAQVRADLTDVDQTVEVLNQTCPDVIVNLAAATNVDECERHPQLAYRANVRIVENLTRWINKSKAPCHLVHISTDHVYDGLGPHNEDQILLTNYYAFSKYAGELVAATVPSTIIRTSFFGPSHSPGRISFSDWIVNAISRGKRISVFEDILFSPLSLDRLAKFIELAIEQKSTGVFNVGSRDGWSKADFAFTLAKALNLSVDVLDRGPSTAAHLDAYRPKDMRMECNRFETMFNVCLPTLDEEIQSMRCQYHHEI